MPETYSETPYFDFNNSKYRFCCCHVITAAYVISVLEVLGIFSASMATGLHFANVSHSDRTALMKVEIAIWVILGIAMIIAVGFNLYAVRMQKPKLTFPLTIMQGAFICCDLGWFIVYLVALTGNTNLKKSLYGGEYYNDHTNDDDIKSALISAVIGNCLGIVAQLRFMYVVYLLRRFLRDKIEFDRRHPYGTYDGAPSVIIQGSYAPQYPIYVQSNQYPVPVQSPYNPYVGHENRPEIN